MSVSRSHCEPNQATCALRAGEPAQISTAHSPEHAPSTDQTSRCDAKNEGSSQSTICKADIARDDLTGLVLGPYALGAKIGGGGMGKVFTARHTSLDKTFAMKFIAADGTGRPEVRARFEQEVKALGKLQHPHIVNAVDAGCVAGVQYLVTEFVVGENLAELVQRRGAMAPAEACELVRQAAVGLAHSHRCGLLHRDIKPSNLILERSGIVKLLDFGLVRDVDGEHEMTMAGEMLGTWDFVAPEQTQDARLADARSDLYSLGCTLLYLLSGQVPFAEPDYATAAAKLKGHLLDEPAWLNNAPAHVPAELVKLLERLTAKSPEKRIQSAEELAAALAPLAQEAEIATLFDELPRSTKTTASRPVGRLRKPDVFAVAAVALLTCGALATAWPHASVPQSPEPPPSVAAIAATPAPDPESRQPQESPPAPAAMKPRKSSPPQSRVTAETKQTYNATAIRIGIPNDESKKPPRTISAAP